MKYILLLLLSIFCVPTMAQRLKLSDLEYVLKTNNISKVQDYLLNKGLIFDKKNELDDEKKPITFMYSFSNINNKNNEYLGVDVNQIENQIYTTSITTNLFSEFMLLKKYAESIGFKLVESDFEDDISFTDFELKNYRLTLVISNKNDNKLYQVCLTDIKLQNFLFSLQE